ncbi:MAG: hypothetical protein H8E38_08990 [SAR324 cluster bacterium]|nr:hypothetical protein [SAR324 cluster bacterium]MBL7034298.1 hypothetical protein [SAR324 cluster bacterium]
MFKQSNTILPSIFSAVSRHLLRVSILTVVMFLLTACGGVAWKNHGDSCILSSEKPPLKRVINYSDHDLCGRKLSPRTAPDPQIRSQSGEE